MSGPNKFCAIDLFAGCGGLSAGFMQAGFDVISQIEMDGWACDTLRTRYLYHLLKKIGKSDLYHGYVRQEITRDRIYEKHDDLERSIAHRVINAIFGEEKIDKITQKIELSAAHHNATRLHVLLGGPPCQPYSLAGRARDPHRMQNDERHFLYRHYLQMLSNLKPDFFVYENVPGLFTARADGKDIFLKILEDFEALEPPYEITPPLQQIYSDPCSYILDSADFLVPQSRKRLILIGYRKSLEKTSPEIKNIFTSLQKMAISNRKRGLLSVDDAIGDLPMLTPGEGNDGWFSPYSLSPDLKSYQLQMRKDSPGVLNHKARPHMRSDLERYRYFIEYHKNGNGGATLSNLRKERPDLLPNHRHLHDFLDRFKVQWWTRPASTIMAHISKDGHYYIHPDIHQCRSFTVREAARCQSFPDNFKFEGPRTSQFKQVGNAVPPLLSYAIARQIMKELKHIYDK